MEKKNPPTNKKGGGGGGTACHPQETHRAFCREAPEKATAKRDAATVGF